VRFARWAQVATLGATFTLAASARAAPDDATRLAARTLGEAGLVLYERGDYAGALEKFDRALGLVQVPTLGVRAARCLAKLGRLVEASERYRQVGAMSIDAQAPAAFQRGQAAAQADADTERAALLARIPTLETRLDGAAPATVTLTLDDKPLPPASVGIPLPVDPGAHRLAARRGADVAMETPTLAEGARVVVVLRLPRSIEASAPPLVPVAALDAPAPGPPPSSLARTLGFVTLGVGVAGLAVWGGTFGAAAAKRPQLDAMCPGHVCRSDSSALDTYNALRLTATGALVAGATLAVAGIVTVLVAPKAAAKPAVAGWLRGGSGLQGTF
jgi:hypothetical protein